MTRSKKLPSGSSQEIEKPLAPIESSFPIVAIGASAGGLEPTAELLNNIPAKTGLAFVIVQHLDPTHPSALTEILSRNSSIPVQEVIDEPVVQPDQVYVIPPNKEMYFEGKSLHLRARQPRGVPNMPIDRLLASLASERKHQSIAIILSGTGSDGVDGCKLIKEAGGVTFAQAQGSAKYPGMPQAAIDAGCVDFVLTPEEIAQKLVQVAAHPYLLAGLAAESDGEYSQRDLDACFEIVTEKTGVDFSQYKNTTLRRRIHRRMSLNKIGNIKQYIQFLKKAPGEAESLHRDVLITVTTFFREPEAFEILKKQVFPLILSKPGRENDVRIWVPGCATGEEPYSIAMALMEYIATAGPKFVDVKFQIFASDINEASIAKARLGLYSDAILKDLSPGRLEQFFVKKDGHYQVQKSIREMCVFARQNVGKDPPFSNLDLISCRNLLIYFGDMLQTRVIPTFHYALRPGGYLLLGGSETLGKFSEQFEVIDKRHKLYRKKMDAPRLLAYFANVAPSSSELAVPVQQVGPRDTQSIERQFDRALLEFIGPSSIIVTEQMEIVHLRGKTSDLLVPPSGQPTFNLNKMAREGVLMDVRSAIKAAKKFGSPVNRSNLPVETDRGLIHLDLLVRAYTPSGSRERYYIISFQESANSNRRRSRGAERRVKSRTKLPRSSYDFDEELRNAKDQYKTLVEEHEATLEEYRSANEEVLSANEELQSLNEELETAKEELQSSNEELRTLNDELHNRNAELAVANDDLSNLFSNVSIPLLMVSNELLIRRFTPQAQSLLNLLETDVGRRISEIRVNLRDIDLAEIGRDVISSMAPREVEVQGNNGTWYLMRVRVFRTGGHVIAGAVFSFQDVDLLKRSLDESRLYAQNLIESARESILVLDSSLRVMTANNSFYKTFRVQAKDTDGRFIFDLGGGQWKMSPLQHLLQRILPEHSRVDDFEVRANFPGLGERIMSLNARRLESPLGKEAILLAIEDVTQLRRSEQALRELSNQLMNIEDEQRRQIARDVHDVTGQKVAALRLNVRALAKQVPKGEANQTFVETVQLADQITNEIRGLSYLLHPPVLDELGLVPALREYVEGISERTNLQIKLDVDGDFPSLPKDIEITIFRIVQESLTNVHRHSGSADAIVQMTQTADAVEVQVSDSGRGFEPDQIPGPIPESQWKSGVGVAGMKERVRQLGGTFQILNAVQGTTILARIPIPPNQP
jgi:two-component system, chemotaxis family, CheB/CheR fusion protein